MTPQCPTAGSPAPPTAPNQIWHWCKRISTPREIGSTGIEYTCTNRAAPSSGIPKPQQVLLSSPQPSELGDGALGRCRGGSHCSGFHGTGWSPERFKHPFPEDTWMRHKTRKQRSTGAAKGGTFLSHLLLHPVSQQVPRLSLRGSFHPGFDMRRGTSQTWLLNSEALP